jgi:hypothetical protein
VSDRRIVELAARQYNRIGRQQLFALGLTEAGIAHRLAAGRLVIVESGVLAVPPVLDDDWGSWMGATLTAPGSELSHASAAAARGFWSPPRQFEVVTRPGSGGPRRIGGVLVCRSHSLDGECEVFRGVPMTKVPRTVLDLAPHLSQRAVARAVRDVVRLELATVASLADCLGRHRGRRAARRVASALTRYTGLPLERARSGAEVRALEILRDAGRPLPRLNRRIAGEEADLSWARQRLIVEIDGGPFHLDVGEDARKQARWEGAGWTVRRLPAADVYEQPQHLLTLAP